ncbi:protein translocase subunit SecDF [Oricola cellulosilytica]|uniref:Multifunctional fusion protein n=1 Tax=Oricola cellulosilytica TaxID=1429082 RepID=A0A4R0P616_9HYPH|nr:protein translocase subunit SecDF [Oricola cellulosilytica]TCD12355.1 protein translocase subunit SecDF [Oricola cellulosilytica]
MLYFSPWKTVLIWLAVLAGILFALPNLFSNTALQSFPSFLPQSKLALGLDLQGGVHLQLKLDRKELVEARLESVRDEVRRLLRAEGIGYTGLSGRGQNVTVRIRDTGDVAQAREILDPLTEPVAAGLLGGGIVREIVITEPEPSLFHVEITDDGLDYRMAQAVAQTVEVIRGRVDELGTTEPVIQRQGTDRVLVQVPGLDDPERLKELIGTTARLTFQMVDVSTPVEDALNGRPPAGTEVMFSTDDPPVPYLLETREIVTGENLEDAQAAFDQRTNEPIVSFRFDGTGAQRFGRATQENVGRPFAIVLDNQVISAPVIREPILGGSGQISGNFTVEGANDLAILLRAGALPLTPTFVEERTVGPSLGADSIAAGEIAGIIGSILVVAFMFLAYGFLGFIANIALIVNVILVIAVLSGLGATLTLPGIAGIVLTVGMAVDSNVLIFERIREERAGGRSVIQAIDTGFQRALTTIIDANVTTLIAAVILFYLGSGPIRGFAVTLAIGIVTTVFTAFVLTRWMIAFWVRRQKPKELPKAPITLVPSGTAIRFMWLRRMTFTASALVVLVSMALFATVNMNLGIDFKGGSLIEVQSKEAVADTGDIRSRLSSLNLGDVQVQGFGSDRDVLIRVESQGAGENAEQTVITKVRGELESDYEFRRVEVVGPTVSGELAQAGTIAVLAALLAILVYIWLRFEWQFAIGAIVATTHDVLLTIGMFVVTGLEFNLSSIAAILTIVGYSLNDTVVVYDRVRENLRRYKKMALPDLLDLSMNQTLPRTILTSLTTLLALLALFFFGGEVLRSFVAAMIFGVVVGTYSSVFIAAPLLILFKLRPGALDRDDSEKAATARTQAVDLDAG